MRSVCILSHSPVGLGVEASMDWVQHAADEARSVGLTGVWALANQASLRWLEGSTRALQALRERQAAGCAGPRNCILLADQRIAAPHFADLSVWVDGHQPPLSANALLTQVRRHLRTAAAGEGPDTADAEALDQGLDLLARFWRTRAAGSRPEWLSLFGQWAPGMLHRPMLRAVRTG